MSDTTPGFALRRATPADTASLAEVSARSFSETFGDSYPPEDLAGYLRQTYSNEAIAALLSDPRYAAWLLERDGVAVGHALAGPCGLPHAQVASGDGELKRLYVLRQAQNGGWGARMFEAALEWLQRDGPRTLWIGVWSENYGAQRFYGRYGFDKVGEYEFVVGQTRDREFILRRDAVG